MKRLGKLEINSEKIIRNEELVMLRGGYDLQCKPGTSHYWCVCDIQPGVWEGCYASQSDADDAILEYCQQGLGDCDLTC
jgi:hypothetical protein